MLWPLRAFSIENLEYPVEKRLFPCPSSNMFSMLSDFLGKLKTSKYDISFTFIKNMILKKHTLPSQTDLTTVGIVDRKVNKRTDTRGARNK